MAESTPELELFKYNESTDADQVFSFDQALNDNWDKIDSFAGAIKSLSNLDAEGEKRFEDIWTELDKKLEAEVLLSENGYIKFNNGLIIEYGRCINDTTAGSIVNLVTVLPISIRTNLRVVATAVGAGDIITTYNSNKTGFHVDIYERVMEAGAIAIARFDWIGIGW